VDTFLLALSGYFGIDCDLKWTGEFLRNVGSRIGIKSANRITGWRLNGYIPDQSLQKILRLDIPDDLKTLALKSRRSMAPGLSNWNFYPK